MTLILSVATPAYALQVGDRLVSKGRAPHDALANKSVVFRASDGLLGFGYTGLAFLGGMPTDTWIADALSGGQCGGDIGALRYGEFPVRDVGSSLRMLCQRLRAEREFVVRHGEVSAVGWQWSSKRRSGLLRRNVLWVLHSGSGELQWQQVVPRHLPERERTFWMVPTGDWPLGQGAWRGLLDRVGTAGADWEAVEGLFVEAIRRASEERRGTIGPHCMSILLRPWRFPNALVRFIPETAHRGTAFEQAVEIAYSPWLVAPDAIHSPAVLVGGLASEQGFLTYSMEVPPVPGTQTLKAAFQSQQRPDA
jgi:hypothetical protein